MQYLKKAIKNFFSLQQPKEVKVNKRKDKYHLTITDTLYNYIELTKNVDVLNGCSLCIYDGDMPDSASHELFENNLLLEYKNIVNKSKDNCIFQFVNKTEKVIFIEHIKVSCEPSFFRLIAGDDLVVQGSVSKYGLDICVTSGLLKQGSLFTIWKFIIDFREFLR